MVDWVGVECVSYKGFDRSRDRSRHRFQMRLLDRLIVPVLPRNQSSKSNKRDPRSYYDRSNDEMGGASVLAMV